MIAVIVGLLVLWLVLLIAGLVLKVAAWLVWLAVVFFVVTAILGLVMRGRSRT